MATNILINALGQALFESCGQALLIYAALQVITHLFPSISAKYRYRVNYLALTAICGWFMVTLVNTYLNAAAAIPNYAILLHHNQFVPHNNPAPTLLQLAKGYITQYAKYITGLYLTGLLLQAFRLAGGLVHISHIRKPENLTKDSLLSQKTRLLGKTLEISKAVSLYFSAHVQVPLTIGHLKPIIIFPLALVNNLDTHQVEAILLHELAHIKRHDYLLNLLQCVMETILCFNPFAWLISKTIREEREYCCDDMVIETEYNNYSYAKALFIVAQQNNQTYSLAMASTGTKKYPLLNRIKRLHTMNANDPLPKFNLAVIIAIAAIGALLAWGIPQYSTAKTLTAKAKKIRVNALTSTPAPVITAQKSITAKTTRHKAFTYTIAPVAGTPLSDTLNAPKTKFKIIIEDDKGNKKEYSSVDEMPAAEKSEFLKENPAFASKDSGFVALANFEASPAWQKQAEDINKSLAKVGEEFNNSPEFKKQMLAMQLQMKKQFNSPQWKMQMQKLQKQARNMNEQFNSLEFKKQQEDWNKQADNLKLQFDKPEWKKQQEDWNKQADSLKLQFDNNPEWQKQVADMKVQAEKIKQQYANNPEWQKQVEAMKIQAEKIKIEVDKHIEREEKNIEKQIKIELDESRQKAAQDSTKATN
jgi:bla regulator protein BlaR1